MNAIPGLTGATITVSATPVMVQGPFGGYTNYVNVAPGSAQITMTNASGTVIAQATTTLNSIGYYTVYADGTIAKPNLLTLLEPESPPGGSSVTVEALNLSTSLTSAVDVYVTAPGAALTTPTLTNIAYQAQANMTLPAAQYQITFTLTGTRTVVASYTSETLPGSAIPRYVLIDSPSGGAPQQITAMFDAG
jgi:hypothetical protein